MLEPNPRSTDDPPPEASVARVVQWYKVRVKGNSVGYGSRKMVPSSPDPERSGRSERQHVLVDGHFDDGTALRTDLPRPPHRLLEGSRRLGKTMYGVATVFHGRFAVLAHGSSSKSGYREGSLHRTRRKTGEAREHFGPAFNHTSGGHTRG